jgi:signal transduction histidine kinase
MVVRDGAGTRLGQGAARPQLARTEAAAAAVVAPLTRLDRLARQQRQASQQAESAAAGQVVLLAGGAMCGGGVVGAALAVFAGRLLGQASKREHELKAALAQLRELDRMKDEFIALVSHELRTPLTAIVGFLELLEDPHASQLDERQQRFAAAIHRNADRLQRLAADVRVLAGQAGGLVVPRQDTDLAGLASRAVSGAQSQAGRRRILLTLALPGIPLPPVRGDDAGLTQVLGHLLSNALKFTPEGGQVRVAVTAEPGWAVLTVADTGIGISAEDQGRIFERFYRAPVAGRRAIQGSGLGLTICRALVDAHGGTITVQSEAGHGTTFRVSLPLGSGQAGAPQPASPAVAIAGEPGPLRTHRSMPGPA